MHRPEKDNGHAVVKDVRCCCRPELVLVLLVLVKPIAKSLNM